MLSISFGKFLCDFVFFFLIKIFMKQYVTLEFKVRCKIRVLSCCSVCFRPRMLHFSMKQINFAILFAVRKRFFRFSDSVIGIKPKPFERQILFQLMPSPTECEAKWSLSPLPPPPPTHTTSPVPNELYPQDGVMFVSTPIFGKIICSKKKRHVIFFIECRD